MVLTLLTTTTSAVEWYDSYGQAKAEAEKTNQKLLIVLCVGDECLWLQRRIEQTNEKEPEDMVFCKVDVTTEYGLKVAKVFNAQKFPITYVTDPGAQILVKKEEGWLTSPSWGKLIGRTVANKTYATVGVDDNGDLQVTTEQPYQDRQFNLNTYDPHASSGCANGRCQKNQNHGNQNRFRGFRRR